MRTISIVLVGLLLGLGLAAARAVDAEACSPPLTTRRIWFWPTNSGPVGETIWISGSGFNTLPASARISFDATSNFHAQEAFVRLSDTLLTVTVPAAARAGVLRLVWWETCTGPTGAPFGVLKTFGKSNETFTPNGLPLRPGPPHATTVSDQDIDVTWADKSNNELGFRITVLEARTRWWRPFDVPANTTSFRLTNLLPDTDYHVDVHAFNAAGETISDPIGERGYARTLPPQSATATLTFSAAAGIDPICQARPFSVRAFFDQDGDGVVAGARDGGQNVVGPYPAYVEEGLWLDRGYAVRGGSRFAVGRNTQGNLVVTAFFDCDGQTAQFVAAHFAIWEQGGSWAHDDLRLAAGDQLDMTGPQRERKGVVMDREGFDGNLTADPTKTLRVTGRAQGTVEYVTPAGIGYQVVVDFEFDAPIELM